ncbi:hypothetical protein [Duganella levis]|jgi:hypothetical protein|uniref:DUF2946 domain-containing protein n=1 Tax=Duganella levis TaxID=2692169 RepID=A0ABW9VUM2_9BURK|nr:hypothetical protein [Duganella levis]MYN25318.1 hypothetical protein [Duganella levis]
MKSRRPFVHLFLALLLLLTQQVGVTHIYSHWDGIEQQQNVQLSDEDHAEHRKRVAVHKVCAECVSVAQMAAAITSSPLTLAISTLSTGPVTVPTTLPACERTTCVFQSRAPPLA